MRRLAIAGAGVLSIAGFAGAASAADLPARTYTKAPMRAYPIYDWSGFYIGIEGGGGWGKSQHYRNDPTTPAVNGLPETGGISLNGGLVGGTYGYNYQFNNNIVVGIENDISWTSNKGSASFVAPFAPLTNTAQTSQSWLDTLRGRLGFAWNRWMFFGSGGAAFADEGVQICNAARGCESLSQKVTGWTAGAGVEYAFAPNWSAKLEYLHVDFGSQQFSRTAAPVVFFARDVTLTENIARVGVNYKFGWDGARYPSNAAI
jgi:outer membrane immunogenic protein